MTQFKTVTVIGLGYIGLPTATVLASRGVTVVGVDVNDRVVNTINEGRIHIIEPELDALVHEVVRNGKLRATLVPEPADAFMIAVPTPFKGDHEPDLSYIEQAGKAIGPALSAGNLVILESTSPVGTTEKLSKWLAEARPDLKFPHEYGEQADVHMAYCPERVLPGHVLRELVENDRIVGGLTPKAGELAVQLYRTFVRGECLQTDARTAEMAKLTENAFRDVNIAFANELSLICDRLSIDVWELIQLANRHPRVSILQPGPGVGGHCIAVDPWFIVDSSPDEARLIRTSREVNDYKPHWVVEQVLNAVAGRADAVVACLGLAFKANIDDLRESPAVDIAKTLASDERLRVLAVEPHIESLPASLVGAVELSTFDEALGVADVIVLLVDHDQFKRVDWSAHTGKPIIDTRGLVRVGR
ncbi:UDP-N-acetyl-D-mannosamine dehydrogenase [Pandoraea cepalis]|uniref:NDP-N-acetyl-D-galactosaminuronic acid dehydrogenase n=1 Tax=Pandoraea cepalis TaxID=2508294 RepID=A0A5E4XFL7_9BURK|nr:UDP-N-acetyl-D-mannosamine dehydrogenase [Pandoraea cepalis]VVE35181.1 Vi polysaccharide biosynthesis protein VipA/TviB [Pandoraea cepalis]